MKKILLFFLFTLSAHAQKDPFGYPSYKTMVRHFVETYNVDTLYAHYEIRFGKTPAGYTVAVLDQDNPEGTNTALFWDRKKGVYVKTSLEPRGNNPFSEETFDQLTGGWAEKFDTMLYFNYPGWEKDVIADLGNVSNPTASQLFALGYAYSGYASDMLSNNSGIAEKDLTFVLPRGRNALTPEQLSRYRLARHKAIDLFRQLYAKEPGFRSIVGEAGIRYANEKVTAFLDLLTFQNQEEALKELEGDTAYSAGMMDYAKNMLASCEPNAILFTYGDNDTFPLLYCQAKLKYRTDVLVLNTSLLQAGSYVAAMRNKILGAEGMPFTLSVDALYEPECETIVLNTEQDTITIPALLTYVQDPKNTVDGSMNKWRRFPSNHFILGSGIQDIDWTFDVPALYRYQLVMLDIIAANNWKRPVYFGSGMGDDSYLGLSRYLKHQGFVYRLTPTAGEVSEDGMGYVDAAAMDNNLEKIYRFPSGHNLPVEEQMLGYDYRNMYTALASYYISNNEQAKAEECLDNCVKKIDNTVSVYGYDVIPIIQSYYELKAFEKGKAVAAQLRYNLDHNIHKYVLKSEEDVRESLSRLKQALTQLNTEYGVKM